MTVLVPYCYCFSVHILGTKKSSKYRSRSDYLTSGLFDQRNIVIMMTTILRQSVMSYDVGWHSWSSSLLYFWACDLDRYLIASYSLKLDAGAQIRNISEENDWPKVFSYYYLSFDPQAFRPHFPFMEHEMCSQFLLIYDQYVKLTRL